MIDPADLPADVRDMLGLDKPQSPEREAHAARFATEFQALKAEYEARANEGGQR